MPLGGADESLRRVLTEAKRLGFLGPGPVEAHLAHSRAFAAGVGDLSAPALDLGSGGGIPGLVLAGHFADSRWVLLEGARRRASFLQVAVAELGWSARITVLLARAEEAGRDPALRGAFSLVTARSFGPPALTAECGAPFLAVTGRLVVSEPPAPAPGRWPAAQLAALGLRDAGTVSDGGTVQVLVQDVPTPSRYPRSSRELGRGPLW